MSEDPAALQEDLARLGHEPVEGHPLNQGALGCHAPDDGTIVAAQGRVEREVVERGEKLGGEVLARGCRSCHNRVADPC